MVGWVVCVRVVFFFDYFGVGLWMDWILICKVLIFGVVEGLMEFLLVLSIGYLIVVGSFLNFNDLYVKMFDVVI